MEAAAVKAFIIYDTLFGNTKQVAETIASGLSEAYQVTTQAVAGVTDLPDDLDLLVIGGPTHRHGLSDGMRDLLDRLPGAKLHDLSVATFDTRYQGPGWLMGSAAKAIGRRLRHAGAHSVITPESFFVARDQPQAGEKRNHETERLEEGEIERAMRWGRLIATLRVPVA